jgi:hypothetical protein
LAAVAMQWRFLDPERDGMVMVFVWVAAAAAASAVPGLGGGGNWWRVNLGMLNALVLAGILASVVLVGLLLAVESVKVLFDVRLGGVVGDVVAVCVFLVGPWAVAALLPAARGEVDAGQPGYAVWGRFCRWALVPLGFLFMGILGVYAARIAIVRELPEGMVAMPVLALGCYGLAALWILEPWRAGEVWARIFARVFPLVFPVFGVLLFVALARRIGEYGFTSHRYVALALAIWIAACCVAELIRKASAPVFGTALLAVLAFLAAFGPLSEREVSLRSQAAQLERLLADGAGGRDEGRIASVLGYLAGNNGRDVVERFTGPLDLGADAGRGEIVEAARRKLGLPDREGSGRVEFKWPAERPIPTRGYRYLHQWDRGEAVLGTTEGGGELVIGCDDDGLAAFLGGEKVHGFDLPDPETVLAAEEPPSLEWIFEGREFLVVVLEAEWIDHDENGQWRVDSAVVLER